MLFVHFSLCEVLHPHIVISELSFFFFWRTNFSLIHLCTLSVLHHHYNKYLEGVLKVSLMKKMMHLVPLLVSNFFNKKPHVAFSMCVFYSPSYLIFLCQLSTRDGAEGTVQCSLAPLRLDVLGTATWLLWHYQKNKRKFQVSTPTFSKPCWTMVRFVF